MCRHVPKVPYGSYAPESHFSVLTVELNKCFQHMKIEQHKRTLRNAKKDATLVCVYARIAT